MLEKSKREELKEKYENIASSLANEINNLPNEDQFSSNVVSVMNLRIGELNAKLEMREENWYFPKVGELIYRSYLYLPKPIECKICKKTFKNNEIARLVFPQLWLVCENCLEIVRKGFFERISIVTLVIQNES